MNKKALGLIQIILGLIVIALVVMGPVRVGYIAVKEKFFGESGIFGKELISTEEHFVPYQPTIDPSLKSIDDSMRALICAIKVTNAGVFDLQQHCSDADNAGQPVQQPSQTPQQQTTPQQSPQAPTSPTGKSIVSLTGRATQEACPGAKYGNVCVECTTDPSQFFSKTLSADKQQALNELAGFMIDCFNKLSRANDENVHCFKIESPQTLTGSITRSEVVQTLINSGSVGQDVVGYGGGNVNYVWDTGDITSGFSFALCGNGKGIDAVFVTTNPQTQCPVKVLRTGAKVSCTVKRFELPQTIDESFAQTWIEAYGDPEYIAYYERFPDGEQAYWQAGMLSMSATVIMTGAVANFVLGPGGGLGKQVAQDVTRLGVKEVRRQAFSKAIAASGFTRLLRAGIRSAGRLFAKDTARQATKKQILTQVLKGQVGKQPIFFTGKWANKVDDLMIDIEKHIGKNGAITGTKEELRASIQAHFKRNAELYKLNPGLVSAQSKNYADFIFDNYAKEITKQEAKQFARAQALRASLGPFVKNLDEAAKLEKQLDAFAAMTVEQQKQALKNADTFLSKIDAGEFDDLLKQVTDQPWVAQTAQKTANFVHNIPGASATLTAARWGAKPVTVPAKAAFNLATWPGRLTRDHKLMAILAASMFASMQDKSMEKFLPHGENALMLGISSEESLEYAVPPKTKYLNMIKDNDAQQRFHLASPCKADIEVLGGVSGLCALPVGGLSGLSIVDLPEGTMPVRADSINYREPEDTSAQFIATIRQNLQEENKWYSGSQVGGNPDYYYKTFKYEIYEMRPPNEMAKYSETAQTFLLRPWDKEQDFGAFAKSYALGTGEWHDWKDVGGQYATQYAATDKNDFYFLVGNNAYGRFDGATWKTKDLDFIEGEWKTVKIDKQFVQKKLKESRKVKKTSGNSLLDYYVARVSFVHDKGSQRFSFRAFHYDDFIKFGLEKYSPQEQAEFISNRDDFANHIATHLKSVDSSKNKCLKGDISVCNKAVGPYVQVINAVVSEDFHLKFPGYNRQLAPVYTESILDVYENAVDGFFDISLAKNPDDKQIFDDMIAQRQSCFEGIETNDENKLWDCDTFIGYVNDLVNSLNLAETHPSIDPSKVTAGYDRDEIYDIEQKYVWDENTETYVIEPKQFGVHELYIDAAGRLRRRENSFPIHSHSEYIGYHHLAGKILDYAKEAIAVHQYLGERKKSVQELKDELRAEISRAQAEKERCMPITFDQPMAAFTPCREAILKLTKITSSERHKYMQVTETADTVFIGDAFYDQEIQVLLEVAEMELIEILSKASTLRELFILLQKLNDGDPGAYCFDKPDDKAPRYHGIDCPYRSYETAMKYQSEGIPGTVSFIGRQSLAESEWDALMRSLYFTEVFDTNNMLVPFPKAMYGLKGYANFARAWGEFKDAEFVATRDRVQKVIFGIPEKGFNYFWVPFEVGAYNEYRNQDCIAAAEVVMDIPALDKAYGKLSELDEAQLMASRFFDDCNNEFGGLYPSFVNYRMKPHYASVRPFVTRLKHFDKYVVPEFRRIASDKNFQDDSYVELLLKKRLIEQKEQVLRSVDEKSGFGKAFRDKVGLTLIDQITEDDTLDWVAINKDIATKHDSLIDKENVVKECRNEKTKGVDFWDAKLAVYRPETINIRPNIIPYSTYNNGYNYCYAAPAGFLEDAAIWIAVVSSVFLDPVVGVAAEYFTGGCFGTTAAVPGLAACARIALAVKGAVEAIMVQEAQQKRAWPKHP